MPGPDPAGRNAIVARGVTTGQVAATSAVSALHHTAVAASAVGLTAGDVVGTTLATSIAAPLGLIGAARSARRGVRADQRLDAIRSFRGAEWAVMANGVRTLQEAGWLEEVNAIAYFAGEKTAKRVERMAIRTGFSTVAATAGIVALAGAGPMTPVGAAGLVVAAGAGGAGAAYSGLFAAKGLGKKIARTFGWIGNERKTMATRLWELAVRHNFQPAIRLLDALTVTVKMPLPILRQTASREHAIAYIMQKMRS
ncbi:MAG: hypothetical protein JO323_16170 [Acidobacteriia bacterium]|nr:hypothetical protein [Terriglobia bacterium]